MKQREIKFRAWDLKEKYLIYNYKNIIRDNKNVTGNIYSILNRDDIIFQQFTGLTDKNNKDTYEGDVIKFNDDANTPYVIDFANGKFIASYRSKWNAAPDEIIYGAYRYEFSEFKVIEKANNLTQGDVCEFAPIFTIIGNIFENPELLKEF